MAEGVGFEPTFAFTKTVFKTVAIVHSATPPLTVLVYEIELSLATAIAGMLMWNYPSALQLNFVRIWEPKRIRFGKESVDGQDNNKTILRCLTT
jgi:hypothetical protein